MAGYSVVRITGNAFNSAGVTATRQRPSNVAGLMSPLLIRVPKQADGVG